MDRVADRVVDRLVDGSQNLPRSPRPAARFALVLALLGSTSGGCGDAEVGGSGTRLPRAEGDPAIHVVVSGTDYQMGWHHGRLLRDEIRRFVPEMLDATFRKDRTPDDAKFLESACRIYATKMKEYVPESVREELRGLAEASGVSADDLFLLEAARDGLMMHERAAHPLATGMYSLPPQFAPTPPIVGLLSSYYDEGFLARFWVILERHPSNRTPTIVLTWVGGLGAIAGLSAEGLMAAQGECWLDIERQSLKGMPFGIGFRTALETSAQAGEFLRALPQTVGHHVVVSDREGRRGIAVVARVGNEIPAEGGYAFFPFDSNPADMPQKEWTVLPGVAPAVLWGNLDGLSRLVEGERPFAVAFSLDAKGLAWALRDVKSGKRLREVRYDWSTP